MPQVTLQYVLTKIVKLPLLEYLVALTAELLDPPIKQKVTNAKKTPNLVVAIVHLSKSGHPIK